MSRKPWMKFYPADWRSDPRLRMCSLAARGLWIELCALMHEAEPYGHLIVAGVVPSIKQIASLVGVRAVKDELAELESAGVFSRREDGALYSRRMVRDNAKALADIANGKGGGNPKLRRDDNSPVNPPDKAQTLDATARRYIPESSIPSASDSDPPQARKRSRRVAGSGSGERQSESGKWRTQAERDDYAQAEIVKRLVPPRGVEPWTVMAKAEDPNDSDHDACVSLVLAAAKAAGVGWISPAERRRRGRPGAPRDASQPSGLTDDLDPPAFLRRA